MFYKAILVNKIEEYAKSIISHTLPISPHIFKCQYCDKFIKWEQNTLTDAARTSVPFYKPLQPPIIAKCDNCKTGVSAKTLNLRLVVESKPQSWNTESELLNDCEKSYINELTCLSTNEKELTNSVLYDDENIRKMMVMPKGPNISDNEEEMNYLLSLIVLIVNNHAWQHKASCFKASSRTKSKNICRYEFPKERKEETKFIEDRIQFKREIGNYLI